MKKGFILVATGMLLLTGCQEDRNQSVQSNGQEQEVATIPPEAKLVESNETSMEEQKVQNEAVYREKNDKQVGEMVEQKKVKTEKADVSFKQSVEIKANVKKEEGKQPDKKNTVKKEEQQQKSISYKDGKYPFTLQLPEAWSNVEVKREQFDNHTQEAVTFIATIGGEKVRLASIFAFGSKEEAMNHIEFGLHKKLGEKDGLTYAYIRASEAPDKLYGEQYEKELKMAQKMIMEDVPLVMDSFTLLP
ncbi:hypothetical protein [Priestia taiwanensis]|uniref:Uncharacterized protein n=1 Tax=Priestia taiwanensis TaxID=1347902 RepID=A0A917AXE5_9BACI|nr:hypothetical protein [Priestia taiwanensis]MBM7364905.1 hypothetical protein [Priestia taiwanensis]GGE82724.1 hypothetical protein GCM10007140_35360 [Priestia taiwanensis]